MLTDWCTATVFGTCDSIFCAQRFSFSLINGVNIDFFLLSLLYQTLKNLEKGFFLSRDPCEESSGRADNAWEDRRGAVRAGGAGR